MAIKAWRLPWRGEWVPHALLDILRGCNISCRACYNGDQPRMKPLAEVREEFEFLASRRRLDSISIVGGEPTLHPELGDIVRMIKQAGVSVELFSNGLRLDRDLLAELKAAGTDMVFLHIDGHQERPDVLRGNIAAMQELWASRGSAVVAAGMEAGLAITAYADDVEEIDRAVDFVLHSLCVDYLLVTLHRDTQAVGNLTGDLDTGIRGHARETFGPQTGLDVTIVYERLLKQWGLSPFAYVGSNRDTGDARWLSYLVGSIVAQSGTARWSVLKVSAFERLFLGLCRRMRGRYPFFMPRSTGRFRMQLLLNAVTGGRLFSNLHLLVQSFGRGRSLRTKKILLQCPAELAMDGSLTHCDNCPDATVRHGKLVPVCIGDQVVDSLAKENDEQRI